MAFALLFVVIYKGHTRHMTRADCVKDAAEFIMLIQSRLGPKSTSAWLHVLPIALLGKCFPEPGSGRILTSTRWSIVQGRLTYLCWSSDSQSDGKRPRKIFGKVKRYQTKRWSPIGDIGLAKFRIDNDSLHIAKTVAPKRWATCAVYYFTDSHFSQRAKSSDIQAGSSNIQIGTKSRHS